MDWTADTALRAIASAETIALLVIAVLYVKHRMSPPATDADPQRQLVERERDQLREQLRLTSSTDYLTGLLNRRAFVEAALHEIANANRYRRSFALIMVDVDRLKDVNDRHGHEAGDAVLAALAQVAEREFRAGDLVCRYGDDELAIFAPECAADDVLALTERVRRAFETHDVDAGGRALRVTCTFGAVAVAAGASADLDGAVRIADEALARAKAAGRNRVVVETLHSLAPS